MIIPMIVGSMSGILTFSVFNVGLVAGPSPGSIFAYMALTPKGNFIGVIAGVLAATLVSFLIASFILKTSKQTSDDSLEEASAASKAMKASGKSILANTLSGSVVNKIVFACDAGLGSSALGANAFKKRLDKAGVSKEVKNYAIEKVPADTDVIVTHKSLVERTKLKYPNTRIVELENFMNDPQLEVLYSELVN